MAVITTDTQFWSIDFFSLNKFRLEPKNYFLNLKKKKKKGQEYWEGKMCSYLWKFLVNNVNKDIINTRAYFQWNLVVDQSLYRTDNVKRYKKRNKWNKKIYG